jgi:pimeloyl-ACP methyl ester carboxylesterase
VVERLPGREVLVPAMTGAETTPDLAAAILAGRRRGSRSPGFSLGGIVALEMVARAPGRVTRLALVGTTARSRPAANHAARREAVALARSFGIGRYVGERLWPLYVAEASRGDAAVRALVVGMAGALGVEAFRAQSEVAIHRADSRPRLAPLAVPTLVLCGEDDRLCTVEVHREMAAASRARDRWSSPATGTSLRSSGRIR